MLNRRKSERDHEIKYYNIAKIIGWHCNSWTDAQQDSAPQSIAADWQRLVKDFIYNVWTSVPRQPYTYKLRLVIPAPPRFPDGSWVQFSRPSRILPTYYSFIAVYRITFEYVTVFSFLRKHATFMSKQTICFDGWHPGSYISKSQLNQWILLVSCGGGMTVLSKQLVCVLYTDTNISCPTHCFKHE